MSNDQDQTTTDFPAIGASGAIGILPNGYFAEKLSQPRPTPVAPSPPISGQGRSAKRA